ncbi:MAG: glutamate synthase subunit beta [Dethiosulfatibacter sp.]|nr:glutamate synthase subunit beta [Dethiosulfatibacter sp.]
MSGKLTGFMDIERKNFNHRSINERVKDFDSVYIPLTESEMMAQANRCMDCGTSFCNWGCPLGNLIPEWNDLVYIGDWEGAYQKLALTANFPEFTGRVCPSLCEAACVLGVNREAVSIREIEQSIVEMAFENGWIQPRAPKVRTNKKIAIIGGGPAGLAAADDLNALGHRVSVYERELRVGGLMRYGIPNYKLDKSIIERRVDLMKAAGIIFVNGMEIGKDKDLESLSKDYDSIIMACGTWVPRDLSIPGRELRGIHFAVDFLSQQTKKHFGEKIEGEDINAKDKIVLVIGGGDTGADCVGTANRQGAKKVYQFEILPKPKVCRDEFMPWPTYPKLFKNTTAHEEGCISEWEVATKQFLGKDGHLTGIQGLKVKWIKEEDDKYHLNELDGTEFEMDVDMVLIAAGFLHTEHDGFVKDSKISLDRSGNVKTDIKHMTSMSKVFAAGDMRTGQSLVVKAILDGKQVSENVDKYLMKYE